MDGLAVTAPHIIFKLSLQILSLLATPLNTANPLPAILQILIVLTV